VSNKFLNRREFSCGIMIYYIIPIIVFGFWFLTRFYSDDGSAIESFQSVDSVDGVVEESEKQSETSRKSKNWVTGVDDRFVSTQHTFHRRIA
jgi:hypothetical protein